MGTIIATFDSENFYEHFRTEETFNPILIKMSAATHLALLHLSHIHFDYNLYMMDVEYDNNMDDGKILVIEEKE